jgi:hypothetical protein
MMKTTLTLPTTLIALSLALAGAARADTGGPTDAPVGRSIVAAHVGGNAERLPGNPGAPAGSIALLTGATSGYPFETPVFASDTGGAPAGSIALLTRSGTTVLAQMFPWKYEGSTAKTAADLVPASASE